MSCWEGRAKCVYDEKSSDKAGLFFDIDITNTANRQVSIWAYDLQLWQTRKNGSECFFINALIQNEYGDQDVMYKPYQPRRIRRFWPITKEVIQQIEDRRQDEAPGFQLRGRILTVSIWPPKQIAKTEWECIRDADHSCWPMHSFVGLDDWLKLLEKLNFQSTLAPTISIPPLPPAFRRSAEYLKQGWSKHHAGDSQGALFSSRNAIECLPVDLFGDKNLKTLATNIMKNDATAKVQAIDELLKSLGNVQHLARHAQSEPISFSKTDSELVLTCTAAILKYLAMHIE